MRALNRCLNRKRDRALGRRRDRPVFRMAGGGPRPRPVNFLARAVFALRKTIQARRRLMRLAPRVFDQAVVNREAEAEARDAPVRAEWQRAIAKVYGVEQPAVAEAWPKSFDSPWPKSSRTMRAIEREMETREIWLEIGRQALRDYQQLRPHHCPGLNEIGRLIEVATRLGRLVTGLESSQPKPGADVSDPPDFRAALRRIYGEPELTGGPPADGTKMV